jgi:hypothetical protein
MLEREQIVEACGSNLLAEDGSMLGTIVDFYVDQEKPKFQNGPWSRRASWEAAISSFH